MQEFDKLPNDVIVLAATNRLDILDDAFISRFPIRQELRPFSKYENVAMIRKFMDDIGYRFSNDEIEAIIAESQSQREIMSQMIQVLAEKIEAE